MKKLLLTSNGILTPRLQQKVLELVQKDSKDIKVLFVPTASDAKKDIPYLERKTAYFKQCEKALLDMGIESENWFWLNINNIPLAGDINSYDVMFVCGGNTFFLLHEIRRTGFDKAIIDFINKGKVYVGESAGSIIVGPDINVASPFDKNEIGLKDTTGLKVTETVICPHYDSKSKEVVDELENTYHCKVLRLKDNTAWEETDYSSGIIQ